LGDSIFGTLIIYSPHLAENDTAYLKLHCARPVTGIVFDTMLAVYGTATLNDTIVHKLNTKVIAMPTPLVCVPFDTFVRITSLCGDFTLSSIIMQDTSALSFTTGVQTPVNIDEGGLMIDLHFFPKAQKKSPYSVNLFLTLHINTDTVRDTIRINFPGILMYNPFILDTLIYSQNSSCPAFDTTWTLLNYTCAPVHLTSVVFADSTHPFFKYPKLPIIINSGDSIVLPVHVFTLKAGKFKNTLLVNYEVFEGSLVLLVLFGLGGSGLRLALVSLRLGLFGGAGGCDVGQLGSPRGAWVQGIVYRGGRVGGGKRKMGDVVFRA